MIEPCLEARLVWREWPIPYVVNCGCGHGCTFWSHRRSSSCRLGCLGVSCCRCRILLLLYVGRRGVMNGVCSCAGTASSVCRSAVTKRRQVLPHTPPLSRSCATTDVVSSGDVRKEETVDGCEISRPDGSVSGGRSTSDALELTDGSCAG